MTDDREQRIREHAYRLWEEEGSPEGRHEDHWHAASSAVDATGEGAPASDEGEQTKAKRAPRKAAKPKTAPEDAASPPVAEPSATDETLAPAPQVDADADPKPRRRAPRKSSAA